MIPALRAILLALSIACFVTGNYLSGLILSVGSVVLHRWDTDETEVV